MAEILNSTDPGQQLEPPVRNRNLVERTSYKLFGYDFVNYRSDCEQSNVNGLIKYHDVVNYGRRMSDSNIHNCVMCGEFDVVIPTQNKDVCKSCDSAFWYNSVLDCAFKFCKGCKNFVTIEMFSDKPDASKCCRCRRRGRDNYLSKKYNVTPQHGSQLLSAFHNEIYNTFATVSPTGSHNSSDPQMAYSDEEENDTTATTNTTTTTTTPAQAISFHNITPYSSGSKESAFQYSAGLDSLGQAARASFDKTAPTSAMKGPYKKRALSVDYTAAPSSSSAAGADSAQQLHQAFYTGAPVKPPKTPRSVSYSQDIQTSGTPAVTASVADTFSSQVSSMGTLDTPRTRNIKTVTPGSELSMSSEDNSGSKRGMVRFALSHSHSSSHGHSTPSLDRHRQQGTPSSSSSYHYNAPSSASPAAAATSSSAAVGTDNDNDFEDDTAGGYLWDRASFHGSPAAPVVVSKPAEPSLSFKVRRAATAPAGTSSAPFSSSATANCANAITRQNSDSAHVTQASVYSERLSSSGASYYGARDVSPTVRFADLIAAGQLEQSRQGGNVDKENQRNSVAVSQESSSASEMMSFLHNSCKGLFGDGSGAGKEGSKVNTSTSAGGSDERQSEAAAVSALTSSVQQGLSTAAPLPSDRGRSPDDRPSTTTTSSTPTGASADPDTGSAPTPTRVRQQWEWDPSKNPLMHLAMITEHI